MPFYTIVFFHCIFSPIIIDLILLNVLTTYYFGVALIEQLQEQEELSDSENVTYQPLRDLSQDLEKILQFLPGTI